MLLELSINIQASDKNISEKISIYSGNNSDNMSSELFQPIRLKRLYEENKIKNDKKLYKFLINTIEEEYIGFATVRWSINDYYIEEVIDEPTN